MKGTKPQSHQFFVAWVGTLAGLVLVVSVLSNLSVGRAFMKKEVSDHWRPAGIVGAAPGSTWTPPASTDAFGQAGGYIPTTPAAPAFSGSWGASSSFGQPVALAVPRAPAAPSAAAGAGRPTLFECPVCGSMRYMRCPRCRERLSFDAGSGHLVCPAGHAVPTIPSCPGCGATMHPR